LAGKAGSRVSRGKADQGRGTFSNRVPEPVDVDLLGLIVTSDSVDKDVDVERIDAGVYTSVPRLDSISELGSTSVGNISSREDSDLETRCWLGLITRLSRSPVDLDLLFSLSLAFFVRRVIADSGYD
jgi:hypothetical protein